MNETANVSAALTPAAEKFIRRMMRFTANEKAGFRLKVRPGGCAGRAVEFDLAIEPQPQETVWTPSGLCIFLDRESEHLLDGATVDFQETLAHTGLVVAAQREGAQACGQASTFVSVEALVQRQ
ncbi:MAG: HesB/IscA family protein [Acidobacteriaceae bacterium]